MDRGPGGKIFLGTRMLLRALAFLAQPAQAGTLKLTAGDHRAKGDQSVVPVALDFSAPLSVFNAAGTASLNGSPVTSELFTTNDGHFRKTVNGKME
jgi:hypothetical protein